MLNRENLEALRDQVEQEYQSLQRKLEEDYKAMRQQAEQDHFLDVSAVEHLMRRLYGPLSQTPEGSSSPAPVASRPEVNNFDASNFEKSNLEPSNRELPVEPPASEPPNDEVLESLRTMFSTSHRVETRPRFLTRARARG